MNPMHPVNRLKGMTLPVDRSNWEAGPWDDEPDFEIGRTPEGLVYLLTRAARGFWLGYVRIPEKYPTELLDCTNADCRINRFDLGACWAFDCNHSWHSPPTLKEPTELDQLMDCRDGAIYETMVSARFSCFGISETAMKAWLEHQVAEKPSEVDSFAPVPRTD